MNIREIFRRNIPQPKHLHASESLRLFGQRLHDPDLWHLNRRSAAGGLALGLFLAWIPIPGQLVLGALGAISLRVNLALTVVGVCLTNPLTMAPAFLFAYKLGAALLQHAATHPVEFQFSWKWFSASLLQIWEPLVLGCLIMGTLSAAVGYFAVRLLWRLHLIRRWKQRRSQRQLRAARSETR
jgi:uncharacterized protein (DUF2062 family)